MAHHNKANLYVMNRSFYSSETTLDKPWNKPWNDQPWKRDLVQLDSDIIKEKTILADLRKDARNNDKLDEKVKLSSTKLISLESKRDRWLRQSVEFILKESGNFTSNR